MSSNSCLDLESYNFQLLTEFLFNLVTQQHLYPSYNTRNFLVPYFLIYTYLLLFFYFIIYFPLILKIYSEIN